MQALDRCVLDHDLLIDDHVQRLTSERLSATIDHDRDLSVDLVPLGDKISLERERMDELAVPESELAVYVSERIEDRPRERSFEQRPPLVVHVGKVAVSLSQASSNRAGRHHMIADVECRPVGARRVHPFVPVPKKLRRASETNDWERARTGANGPEREKAVTACIAPSPAR